MSVDEHGQLPQDFLSHIRSLEESYCASDDPIRQSGFAGGYVRWRAERSPVLEGIDTDGDLLDVGCANGYLLECLIDWARQRGLKQTPHGLDIGPRLIALARQRLPQFNDNFHVGNAWDWQPPRKYDFVYSVWDCVPEMLLKPYCERITARLLVPGGRLIVGMYGSRSRNIPPIPLGYHLRSLGFEVAGETTGGDPPVTAFAWTNV